MIALCVTPFFQSKHFAEEAFMVTDVGTSAKMLSIGQIEGFDRSSTAILENPAALSVNRYSTSVFSTKLFNEVEYRNVNVASYKNNIGTFGLGYMSATVQDIPETDLVAGRHVEVGSVKVNFQVLKLAYQRQITSHLSLGSNFNYYKNVIGSVNGSGINLDLGALYSRNNLTYSVSAKNIVTGRMITYNNGDPETLPFQLVAGVMLHKGYFDFLTQIKSSSAYFKNLKSLGVHFNPGFLELLHLNAGYKEYLSLGKIQNHYTFGVGLELAGISFDYAYEKSDHLEFDNNNYFSFKFDF